MRLEAAVALGEEEGERPSSSDVKMGVGFALRFDSCGMGELSGEVCEEG